MRFYCEREVELTTSIDEELKQGRGPGTFSVWVLENGVPDAYGSTPEEALGSGLKWLSSFIDKLVGTTK